jgi:hypothetical protein
MSSYTWIVPSPAVSSNVAAPSNVTSSSRLRGRSARALDLVLDLGDFVDAPDGTWLESDDSRTAVIIQLESFYNKWWGDSSSGSFLREILSADIQTVSQVRDECLRALQVMVAEGVISNLSISTEEDDLGRAAFILDYTDRASGRPVDLALVPG